MPIIPIKLNHNSKRRDKRINTEFLSDHVLRQIFNAQIVKHRVSDCFDGRLSHRLLFLIHQNQHFCSLWIFVSALQRAILDIVLKFPRWRPFEGFLANTTRINILVSAPPYKIMLLTTKMISPLFEQTFPYVNICLAMRTRDYLTILPIWSLRCAIAAKRAVCTTFRHFLCDDDFASNARQSPFFVSGSRLCFHVFIVPSTSTIKYKELMKYASIF